MIVSVMAGAMVLLSTVADAAASDPVDSCAPVNSPLVLAPPIGRTLRLVVTTARPARDGSTRSFGLEYRLVFQTSGRGLLLTVTLVRLDAGSAGGISGAMQAILGPLVGRPVTYLVSADGQALLLQNGDALWASIARDLAAAARRAGSGDGQNAGDLLASLSPEQREALLTADVRHILRFAGRDWTSNYVRAPADDKTDCGSLKLIEKLPPAPAEALFQTRQSWLVDINTGLVRRHDEEQLLRRGTEQSPESATQTHRILSLIE